MIPVLLLILLGATAGTLSGILGLGGGVFIVPALVLLFGYSQHLAQGTTLALLVPPIGLLAAWTYYRHGHVNLPAAAWICLGFFAGGLLGARIAVAVPEPVLRRVFGGFLLLLSVRMIFFK